MLRALNAMHYSSDESIDEDLAFNSEDEAKYGKFFEGKSSDDVLGYGMTTSASTLLGVQISVRTGDSDVVTMDVLEGTKLMLSSACVDVPGNNFQQSKLMFRCIYEKGEEELPWMCICNFLGLSNMVPSASLSNLEIVGPCVVEWKTSSTDVQNGSGSLNLFGQIVPTDTYGSSMLVNKDTDVGENTSLNAKSSNGKRKDLVHAPQTDEQNRNATKPAKSNKRKLSHDLEDIQSGKDTDKSAVPKSQESPKDNNNKLSKKQRKQLAEEKTKQLEETLTAARDTKSETKSKKKKKKKKSETKSKKKKKKKTKTDQEEPLSKPTSLTRERRLPGGIVVSDILIGTGTTVSSGRKISLHYTGKLTNGKVFDKNYSRTQPLQFRQGTGEVIRGLERGLEGMRVGGERLITVPSALGYGEKGAGAEIPPDSDLVFEVKVLKVG